jgi:hypothetical protein
VIELGLNRFGLRPLLWASAVVVAALLALSIGQGGARSFTLDSTVRIVSPAPLSTVSQPSVIRWTGGRRGEKFAVFVDLTPIGPGHNLRDLATPDCKQAPTCEPTADYLAGLGVFLTSSDEVTVPMLQPVGGVEGENGRATHPVHTATVVEMNSADERVGDASWQVQFHG